MKPCQYWICPCSSSDRARLVTHPHPAAVGRSHPVDLIEFRAAREREPFASLHLARRRRDGRVPHHHVRSPTRELRRIAEEIVDLRADEGDPAAFGMVGLRVRHGGVLLDELLVPGLRLEPATLGALPLHGRSEHAGRPRGASRARVADHSRSWKQSSKPMKAHHSPSTNTGNAAIERDLLFVSSTRSCSGNVADVAVARSRAPTSDSTHRENPASAREAPCRVGLSNCDVTPGAHHSASWVARYPRVRRVDPDEVGPADVRRRCPGASARRRSHPASREPGAVARPSRRRRGACRRPRATCSSCWIDRATRIPPEQPAGCDPFRASRDYRARRGRHGVPWLGPGCRPVRGAQAWSGRTWRGQARRGARDRGLASGDGHRSRDFAASLNISSTAFGSSAPGRCSITPSAVARSQMSCPRSVRTIESVHPSDCPRPPKEMSACSAAKSGQCRQPGPGEPLRLLQGVDDLVPGVRVEEQLPLDVHAGEVVEVEAELLLGDLHHQAVVGEGLGAEQSEGPRDLPPPLVHPPDLQRARSRSTDSPCPTSATFERPISAAFRSAIGFAEYV